MALVLTHVYLEPEQKKALTSMAKRRKRKMAELMREAVDAYLLGITAEEVKLLDEATKRAKTDIDAMNAILDNGLARADRFFAEIDRLRSEA